MTQSPPPPDMTLQRSSRDAAEMGERLTAWLVDALPPGAEPQVVVHDGIQTNGMSSETVLLGVSILEDGERITREYVARVAPAAGDLPVFPEYRLTDQYDAMRLAGELAGVPVPPLWLNEPTGTVLGTPFFLMQRVDGAVPPDVLPYTFGDNWLFDAEPTQQRALQRRSVEVLARLHGIGAAATTFAFLDPAVTGHTGATTLARNLAKTRAWYDYAVNATDAPGTPADRRSPLIERGLAWLEAHLPAEAGEPVLVWGDARIGNMMYREFTPVAVLDWEMATLGPRELDVAWMVFAHRVFQEIAGMLGLPGMPDFLRAEDVAATYAELTGIELGDLTWYQVHAGVLWGCVFLRTSARQIHFGEIEKPEDPEAVFHHRPLFERLLDEVGA
ncbi:phosphotransferase family protein [Nocardioides sp. zg-536]|uniref:Phosphotransferase family protein n=1 Tax=Nocardioides faecalis TaxID=2803858 RepID=A0A938Y0N7_9ACTN|nr:phosphotransferase family protein [Nocardioides faecalis]MBM9459721.1 phosphotransferase family protein [Nocardioides faecalis]QVI58240.1 phosphotransferase family protein [Nocardioides faecalis]